MKNSLRLLAALAFGAVPLAPASHAAAPQGLAAGAVFVASNDARANTVLAFERDAAGMLVQQGVYPTGGLGTGEGLGNQGALVLDESGQHLFVVNAGSGSVSVFGVGPQGLVLRDVEGSGGPQPISVTVSGGLVYVLNEGDGGNVTGFELMPGGQLGPLAGATQPLSAPGVDPAQIAFTPDGKFLVVTEKDTNSIVTYAVDASGVAGPPVVSPSAGMTPFGFDFGKQSRILCSEASGGMDGASTVSSYDILADGTLSPVTSALATTQSAACWLVTTPNRRFAYVTNTGSATVTGLRVGTDGALHLLMPSGISAASGTSPIDAGVSRNGRYLYVLNGGDGTVQAYAIGRRGELTSLQVAGGLPASANGLAVL